MFKKIELNFSEQFKTFCLEEISHIKNLERSTWKLDNKINLLWKRKYSRKTEDIDSIKSLIIYYESIRDTQSVFSQIPISDNIKEKIFEYLPKKLLEKEIPKFYWQLMENGNIVPAHIDGYRNSCLNFYLNVNDEETIFYNKKRNGIKLDPPKIGRKIDVDNAPEFFCPEWLEYVDSFKAKEFDCYLLDVTKVHSVINEHNNKTRVCLTVSFNTKFEQVYQLIYE